MIDRELDAEVAEKVFGWRREPQPHGVVITELWFEPDGRQHLATGIPAYSTSIIAAWAVVDRLFDLKWQVEIWCEAPNSLGIPKWHVMLKCFGKPVKWKAVGDTAPEAICRAALMAVGTAARPAQTRGL